MDLQKIRGSWHFRQWKPSGWNRLCLAALSENRPPQVAIDSLWLAAGEGRIQATAIESKNAKAFDGDLIEIPAHHWARLKRADDARPERRCCPTTKAGSTERFSFPDWTSKNFGQSQPVRRTSSLRFPEKRTRAGGRPIMTGNNPGLRISPTREHGSGGTGA